MKHGWESYHWVSHLIFFSCISYSLVNLRSKLDKKSNNCIFNRYSSQSKAYRLYNHTNGKVIIRRNVVLNEESAWEWNDKVEDSVIHIPAHKKVVQTRILETSSDLSSPRSRIPTILIMEVALILLFQALVLYLRRHSARRHQQSSGPCMIFVHLIFMPG